MTEPNTPERLLEDARVEAEVFALRPDYRAVLLAVDGRVPGPSDAASEALLQEAEAATARALADRPVDQLAHVAAWREAYRAFGAKPQRTRNSLEALTRRAASGLQRVGRAGQLFWLLKFRSMRPPSRSVTAPAVPLYGTCSRSIPAFCCRSAIDRWCGVPTPGLA